jgi:hypothetical protein
MDLVPMLSADLEISFKTEIDKFENLSLLDSIAVPQHTVSLRLFYRLPDFSIILPDNG